MGLKRGGTTDIELARTDERWDLSSSFVTRPGSISVGVAHQLNQLCPGSTAPACISKNPAQAWQVQPLRAPLTCIRQLSLGPIEC